jgi:hypothetical protein
MQKFCFHVLVIAPPPFRSRIAFFIPIMSTVHVIPIHRRPQALLPASSVFTPSYPLFRRFRRTTPTSHSLVIAIFFCSRNSSAILITSTGLHLVFTIILLYLHQVLLPTYSISTSWCLFSLDVIALQHTCLYGCVMNRVT